MISKRNWALGLILLLAAFSTVQAGQSLINSHVISSTANAAAALTLEAVPLNITEATDTLTLRFTPEVQGVLYYAQGSPGTNLSAYTPLNSPFLSQAGVIRVVGNQLPVGPLTCFIQSASNSDDRSTFFQILRASGTAATPLSPITSSGGVGVSTTTPTLIWQGVTGVPYYLVFVADQPFEIKTDENGGTAVEGANIIWQAITSSTSIQYGVPDPSGTIANDLTPPLIGSNDRTDRPRYNWTVLNCYGNSIEYTSSVVGQVSGFEVELPAPFGKPEPLTPARSANVYDEEILFSWTPVPQATSYFVYLSRFQNYSNGTEILFPVWTGQTTDNALVLPAASLLQANRYNWKVIASDGLGSGSISDSSSFAYHVDSGTLRIITQDSDGNRVDLAQVDFEALEGPSLQSIATDDNGSYNADVPVGRYILTGHKTGYIDDVSGETVISDGVTTTVTLTLDPRPSTIVGRVVSSTSTAIGGATVKATSVNGDVQTTTTNISGEFTLLVDPSTYSLVASAAGYQNSSSRSVTVASGQTYDLADGAGPLTLTAYSYRLSGTVTNISDQPIPLAKVTLVKGEETLTQYTGQSGQFSFDVGNGIWTLAATKAGFYLPSGAISVSVSGANVTRTIVLNPQAAIVSGFLESGGSVLNRGGVLVKAVPDAGDPVTTTSADNGSFNIGLPPGAWELKAELTGYTASPVTLNLTAGQTANGVSLGLSPNPSSITGTVKSLTGAAIPSATVTASGVTTTTNSSGLFQLSLPAGSHTINASKSGYTTVSSGPWSVAWGETVTGVQMSLSPNVANVSGKVTYGGSGVINATVTATSSGGAVLAATTSEGGVWSLGLEPGSYTIAPSKSGFVVLDPATRSYDLQPGSTVSNANFALQPNTGSVSGTIVDASGPVYGASVTVRKVGTTTGGVVTSSSVTGAFNVSVEAGAAYTITASKAGYASSSTQTSTLTAGGSQSATLTLSLLGASFGGTITSSTGSPLAGATVIASSASGQRSATTDASGVYRVSLLPGTWTVDISATGHLPATGEVTLSGGQNLSGVNYTLTANYARLSGLVRDAGSAAVSGADVTLSRRDGSTVRTTTDAAGLYTFSQLTGGNAIVIAAKSGYASDTLDVGLIVDGQVISSANMTLTALTGALTGTVTSNAVAVSGVTVRATSSTGAISSAVSGTNGSYSLPGIAPGLYTIEALKSGFTGSTVSNQSVTSNTTTTVNLTLAQNTGSITGTVTNASSTALANVQVGAVSSTGHSVETTTGTNGAYTLSGLQTASTYTITFTLQNYSTVTRTGATAGNTINAALTRNALSISGTVTDQEGTPLAGVPLKATSTVDGTVLAQVTSASNGQFSFSQAAPSTSYRIVSSLGQANVDEADKTVTTTTTNLTGVTLQLTVRTASISGSVTVANASILATRTGGSTKLLYANSQGVYSLTNLNSGTWTLAPSKQGTRFTPASREVTNLGVGEARTGVDFIAETASLTVSGQLVDDVGDPYADGTVVLLASGVNREAIADASGDFTFTGVPGFTTYSLDVRTGVATRVSETVEQVLTNQNVSDIEIEVQVSEGVIRGMTSDGNGAALGQVYVTLDGTSIQRSSTTGSYVYSGLTAGEHILTFQKDGYGTVQDTVTLTSGFESLTHDASLTAGATEIKVVVLLNSTDVVRMPGIRVTIDGAGADNLVRYTNSLGEYIFTGLNGDSLYTLTASAPGLTSRTYSSRSPGSALTVTLTPAANVVYGRVVDASSVALANATVQLRTLAGELRETTTDSQGRYRLLTADGAMTVMATASGGASTSYVHSFAVPSGTYRNLDMQMRSSGEISGTIRTSSDAVPAARALLETENSSAGTFAFQYSETDGSYRIRGLRPGSFTVTLTADGYVTPDAETLELDAGETQTLNWVIDAASTSIAGRVVDGEGAGVPDVAVTATGPSMLNTTTSGSGDFSFTDVAAGSWTVSATRFGYQNASSNITVTSGEVASANLTLTPIANTVSGRVYEDDGVSPDSGTIVRLYSNAAVLTASDTSDVLGQYLMAIPSAGTWTVETVASSSPAEWEFDHTVGEGHPDHNFTLLPSQETGTVTVTLTYRSAPVAGATVTLLQLDGANQYGGFTNSSGMVSFTATAPASYVATAVSDDYGTVSSSVIDLAADQTVNETLAYASGQIGVSVVDQAGDAVSGVAITLSSLDGSYTNLLVSDLLGIAVTEAELEDGQYTVEAAPVTGLLPTAPRTVTIAGGDSVGVTIPLGFAYTPPTVGNVGDSLAVRITVPGSYTIVSSLLYYIGVGESFTRSVPMVIVADPHSAPSAGPTVGRASKRNVSRSEFTALRKPSPQRETTTYLTNAPGDVTYEGKIPPQSGSGSLTFYPELTTDEGLVIGGPSGATTVTISSIGILDHLEVTPSLTESQPGVPTLFTVRAFDELDSNLTAALIDSGVIEWSTSLFQIDTTEYSADSAVYLATGEGDDTIRVTVTQNDGGAAVIVSESIALANVMRELGDLQLTAPALEVAAGDSLDMDVVATDTSGALMRIAPEWEVDSLYLDNLEPAPFTQRATFYSDSGSFGTVRIVAVDPMSGTEAVFNDQGGSPAEGLSIYVPIAAAPGASFSAEDATGARVEGTFGANAVVGNQGRLFLRRPELVQLQRFPSGIETISQSGYRVLLQGNLNEERIAYTLTLPVPSGSASRTPQIARWNIETLLWDVLGGDLAADNSEVSVAITPTATLGIDGLYTLIVDALPLDMENLTLTPNPFSPKGTRTLSIEFTLHSIYAEVLLTIKIYNMVGQPVRTLLDQEPMEKGEYSRSGGVGTILWDGLTDDGRQARNGRYVVQMIAEDAGTRKEELRTVVLIK